MKGGYCLPAILLRCSLVCIIYTVWCRLRLKHAVAQILLSHLTCWACRFKCFFLHLDGYIYLSHEAAMPCAFVNLKACVWLSCCVFMWCLLCCEHAAAHMPLASRAPFGLLAMPLHRLKYAVDHKCCTMIIMLAFHDGYIECMIHGRTVDMLLYMHLPH
jgi:hypothetical protein